MNSEIRIPVPVSETVSGLPGDLIAITVLAVALFFFGLTGGKRFSLSFLFALYLSEGMIIVLPSLRTFLLRFGTRLPEHTPAIVFLVATAVVTWLLAGGAATALFRFSGRGVRAFPHILVATALATGLFVTFFFPLLPSGTIRSSSPVRNLFLTDPYPFLWVLASLAFFAFMRGKEDA